MLSMLPFEAKNKYSWNFMIYVKKDPEVHKSDEVEEIWKLEVNSKMPVRKRE